MLKGFLFQIRDMIFPHKRMRPMMRYIKENNKQKKLIGVEIGVQNGVHAKSILENLSIKKLFLVDPYYKYKKYGRGDGNDNWAITMSQSDFNTMFIKTLRYLNKYKNAYFIHTTSETASLIFFADELDFVYIDGNHSYDFVTQDMNLWFPKIKKNGVIGGHDYDSSQPSVVKAVDDWVKKNKQKLYFYGNDWWIIKK